MTTPADGKTSEQNARDELRRGKTGEGGIERQYDRAIEPGCGEQPQLRPLVREPEQRLLREKNAGWGSNVSAAAGRWSVARTLDRSRDHRAMAAMHPVEIADRDDGAAQSGMLKLLRLG